MSFIIDLTASAMPKSRKADKGKNFETNWYSSRYARSRIHIQVHFWQNEEYFFAPDKPLIIANSCGCGDDIESPQAYIEIREAYQEMHTCWDWTLFKRTIRRWTINMEDEYTKIAMINSDRHTVQICYVIGQNNGFLINFR